MLLCMIGYRIKPGSAAPVPQAPGRHTAMVHTRQDVPQDLAVLPVRGQVGNEALGTQLGLGSHIFVVQAKQGCASLQPEISDCRRTLLLRPHTLLGA